MTSYETLFIVRPDIDEDDLNKVIGRVEDVVKSNAGTIVESQVWGKKRLAYEVKKCTEGIYVKMNFDAPPAVVEKLQDHFRLNEDVIRDLVVRDERRRIEPARSEDESAAAVKETGPVAETEEAAVVKETGPVAEAEEAAAVKETGPVAETEEAAEVKAEDEAAPPEEEVGEVGEERHTQQ